MTEAAEKWPSSLFSQAEDALRRWIDPVTGYDLITAGRVSRIEAFTFRLYVDLTVGFPADRYSARWVRTLESHLLKHTQAKVVMINFTTPGSDRAR